MSRDLMISTTPGEPRSYSVTSYKQNTQGKELPVAWSTEYSTDNGQNWTEDKPDWLTAFTMSGEGGKEKKFSATVIAQTGIDYSSHTEALQGAPVKGSEITPYNLSNKDGGIEVQNTANCYVVNAPGYYSFTFGIWECHQERFYKFLRLQI